MNRLYSPLKGRVLIDEVDVTQTPLSHLRNRVGIINQENSLFSGTVLENITLGQESPNFAEAIVAAKAAEAHEFISRLPEGYSTRVGEGGRNLSGGQRRRIHIARAVYRNPTILVMDEATSALDGPCERAVVQNLKKLRSGRTNIIIAHRLNTIRHADRIAVFDSGRIAELGSHDDLLASRGIYFQLFLRQLDLS